MLENIGESEMIEGFRFRINKGSWINGYQMLMIQEHEDGKISIIKDITVDTHSKHVCIPESSIMHINEKAAQGMMDELWDCGVRPTEEHGSKGTLSAVENHLNDMRKIVSKKLGVNL